MDYLNTYKKIGKELVLAAEEGKVLHLLGGTVGCWFYGKGSLITDCVGYCYFDFDLLKYFPFIWENTTDMVFEMSFEKVFEVKLGLPWKDEWAVVVNGRTLYQALAKLNNRLKRQTQDIEDAPIINFESYKRNLQLLKK